MNHAPPQLFIGTSPRVAVLKSNRLSAEMITKVVARVVPLAVVFNFQRLSEFEAWELDQDIELLITGLGFEDGSGIDIIKSSWIANRPRRRVLVVTDEDHEARTVNQLSRMGVSGIFDTASEGATALEVAIFAVLTGSGYWSPSVANGIAAVFKRRATAWGKLTKNEQRVLAAIGDGSDDKE